MIIVDDEYYKISVSITRLYGAHYLAIKAFMYTLLVLLLHLDNLYVVMTNNEYF